MNGFLLYMSLLAFLLPGPVGRDNFPRAAARPILCASAPRCENKPRPPVPTRGRAPIIIASWYGIGDGCGSRTANGERFDRRALTAAHQTLPFGTRLRLSSRGGKSIIVRVNDRGPYVPGRTLDLTPEAFRRLAPLSRGVIRVKMEVLR